MTKDLQLMRDDIVDSAYKELVAQVNAMIDAAVRQERERCAVICDGEINPNPPEVVSTYNSGCYNTAEYLADAIRSQGKTNE